MALLALALGAAAQSGGSYTIVRHSIDSGAGTTVGGVYALAVSVGQFDAGALATSPSYQLQGGFLGGTDALDQLFRNGFEP
jgi:hypothetical protein